MSPLLLLLFVCCPMQLSSSPRPIRVLSENNSVSNPSHLVLHLSSLHKAIHAFGRDRLKVAHLAGDPALLFFFCQHISRRGVQIVYQGETKSRHSGQKHQKRLSAAAALGRPPQQLHYGVKARYCRHMCQKRSLPHYDSETMRAQYYMSLEGIPTDKKADVQINIRMLLLVSRMRGKKKAILMRGEITAFSLSGHFSSTQFGPRCPFLFSAVEGRDSGKSVQSRIYF